MKSPQNKFWILPLASALLILTSCAAGDPDRFCKAPKIAEGAETRAPEMPGAVAPKRVFMVILENTDADMALTQPFFKELMKSGATLTNFHGITHPSQPNYIALTAGSTLGVDSNQDVNLPERNLVDLLEEKGKSWKLYAEGYPGNCFLGSTSGAYARKHVPFLSYLNVQKNAERCARVVPAAQLQADLSSGELPEFSMYIPDNNNNGHDTGIEFADQWFRKTFGPLLNDPVFMKDSLVILTFDESSNDHPNNAVSTLFLGDSIEAGSTSNGCYDHYDLLRTVEDTLGLGHLGREDARSSFIEGIWR